MTNLKGKILRQRAAWRRFQRLLFASPAEIKFIQIMDGTIITLPAIKHRVTGYTLTITISLGHALEYAYFSRELRVGKYYVDFGSRRKKVIEIDGHSYHTDVVAQAERDEYLRARGYAVLHIEAWRLYKQPDVVRQRVIQFVTR